MAAWLVLMGPLTWRQAAVWVNSETLWRHALAVDPHSTGAANNLGAALLAQGRTDEASSYFARTVIEGTGNIPVVTSEVAAGHFQAGLAAQRAGALDEASRHYHLAVAADARFAAAWNNLGVIHATRGDFGKALKACGFRKF